MQQLNAQLIPLDFSNPQQSTDYVNNLVDQSTGHMIPSIISSSDFSQDPKALILLSILFIHNSWTNNFEDRTLDFYTSNKMAEIGQGKESQSLRTRPSCFSFLQKFNFSLTITGGKKIDGFGGKKKIPYLQTLRETMVEVLASDGVSLIIRMKHNGTVEPIDYRHLSEFNQKMTTNEKIDFTMPCFEIENYLDLKSHFAEKMPELLSGKPFWIHSFQKEMAVFVSKFIQKNKLEVTRDGLKGASITMMDLDEVAGGAMPRVIKYKKITIDRPFSFLITKQMPKNSQLVLFAGHVIDPTLS